MFPYIPNTDKEQNEMLKTLSMSSIDDLFKDIPDNIKLNRELNLKNGLSELEVYDIMNNLAKRNKSVDDVSCFLGAGIYDHYIPSIIKHLLLRSEFYTAYTPYQPEISQGTLQSIFEFQSMLCNLTGMEVSNSSMYDAGTAAVEASVMAKVSTRRNTILVSKTVNPEVRRVLKTYLTLKDINLVEIEDYEGSTDIDKLESLINKDVAGIIIQSPNFFGIIEDIALVENIAHNNKSLLITSVDPLSLGVLKSPGELGADIVIGEGQGLGCNMSFGGPGFGFLNTTKKLMRKMPGRIVGETDDGHGKRGFVLTLQAREQHIRREKATSNICSDQTLMAIGAAMYMATLGKNGIKEIGMQCIQKSHYAYNKLIESGKYKPAFNKPFFKEFVIKTNKCPDTINNELMKNDILGGYNLGKKYPKHENSMMLCVTEKRTKQEIDKLVSVMEGI